MNLRKILSYLPFHQHRVRFKGFSLGLMVVTLAGVLMYGSFDLANPSFATMCSTNDYTVRIIDRAVTQNVSSLEALNNPPFKLFIVEVKDHVLAKFVGKTPCQANSDNQPIIELVFIRLPLMTSGNDPFPPAPKLDVSQAKMTCRLDSPWTQLAVRRSNDPKVRAVFMWNERQFLLDQVWLSGQRPSLKPPLIPLTSRSFREYATDYANTDILQSPSGENATTPISQRIPADVLWLFRHSSKTTFLPFSEVARSGMRKTTEQGVTGYIHLTKTLVDQCFGSGKAQIRYENILDLQKIFTLDQYRIN